MVATKGRKVVVADEEGERDCFLAGQRAVVGDRVHWVPAPGEGGKLTEVLPRERTLVRRDFKGRDQVIAANLGGLAVVASAQHPPYRPGLIDRYLVAATAAGLDAVLILTKTDLGVSEEVEADLAGRRAAGLAVIRCAPDRGEGLDEVRRFLEEADAPGPWAFVGHSGVGKTSLIQALLPEVDVGPVGTVSEHWDQGRHTTTSSHVYALGTAEVADSPGIRTFLPSGLEAADVRGAFPGMPALGCRYRDCLHRPGEDGCVAEAEVGADLLARYRRLLDEVLDQVARARP